MKTTQDEFHRDEQDAESSNWVPIEVDRGTDRRDLGPSLLDLATANVPAVIFRDALPREACQSAIDRLLARELMYDPQADDVAERFLKQSIPEGYYRRGNSALNQDDLFSGADSASRRIDIGTSLGYRGSDRDGFFDHAQETHNLFSDLFAADADPIRVLYDRLAQLAGQKEVITAYEDDGRQYGPAIIRVHYGSYSYPPHFDSVRHRERRTDYSVYRFEHQFAGVLVLQNAVADHQTAQCVIHHCLWQPDLDEVIAGGKFHEYAKQHQIENCRVELQPGDLYFFNTRCIHEVPGVDGELPRVVVATFIGYSPDDDEIMVWA